MVKLTNTAQGPRGVKLASGGTLYIDAGQTVDVDVANGHDLYEGLVEGDGAPSLSSMKKADLVAIADAEGVAYETDDKRADLIEKIEAHRGAAA